jgi:hypothetical protein
MIKMIRLFVALSLLVTLTPSCGKKGSSSSSACQLLTVTDSSSSNTVYNITYNNSGQISSLVATGLNAFQAEYAYAGNVAIASVSNSGGPVSRIDTTTLNSDGYIQSVVSYYPSTQDIATTTYTYGANDQVLKSIYQDGSSPAVTTTYTFTNGNLTSLTNGTITMSYTYYTNMPYQEGDVLQVSQLVGGGFPYIKNVNLCQGYTNSSGTVNFTYSFDSNGKINRAASTVQESLLYQYSCD